MMDSSESEPYALLATLRLLDTTLKWMALILGGGTLGFMTLFSAWNVLVMRKAFNSPVSGAEDLLVLALVAIVALSIPYGARTGAHIEIELLESSMSRPFSKWSLVIVKLFCALLLWIAARQLWHAGQSAVKFGETTQQLLISYEPFYYMLSVSTLLYFIVLLTDIWQLLRTGHVQIMKTEG
jgi:TRAP-type C4-dicarboxylate transport system permease small subunit